MNLMKEIKYNKDNFLSFYKNIINISPDNIKNKLENLEDNEIIFYFIKLHNNKNTEYLLINNKIIVKKSRLNFLDICYKKFQKNNEEYIFFNKLTENYELFFKYINKHYKDYSYKITIDNINKLWLYIHNFLIVKFMNNKKIKLGYNNTLKDNDIILLIHLYIRDFIFNYIL